MSEKYWKTKCREQYDVFSAMRNDLNEIMGNMESPDATLLRGPEMSHDCEAVVIAVREFADKKEGLK